MVPTIVFFGEGSTLQSVEAVSNNNVAMVILPGKNREVGVLHTCKKNLSEGK